MYPTQHTAESSARRPRFFDPGRCPDCGTPINAPAPRCARCGLLLTSANADQLAGQLAAADQTMARLRLESQAAAQQAAAEPAAAQWTAAPMAAVTGPPPAGGMSALFPLATPAAAHSRRWPAMSGAAVVLGLGGLCMLVAAIVFISVSWGSLSLGAKAATLAAITVALALASEAVTRKGLRGSAETLWASTLLDLALDLWAIHRADLAGLHSVDARGFAAVGAVLVAAAALASTVATRRPPLRRPLVSAQVILGGAAYLGLLCALASTGASAWLQSGIAVMGMTALAILARVTGLRVTAWVCGLAAAQSWLDLVGRGVVEMASDRFLPQLWHGHANELPVAIVLALGAASVPAVLCVRELRLVAAVAGVALAAVTGWVIGADYLPPALSLAGVLLTLALLSLAQHPVWRPALGMVLGVAGSLSLLVLLQAVLAGVSVSVDLGGPIWQRHPGDALLPAGQPVIAVLPALALLAAALATVLLSRSRLPDWALPWTTVAAGPTALASWLNSHPPLLVATIGWLLLALASVLLARRDRWQLAAPGLMLAFALITALASEPTTILAFAVAAGTALAASRSFARDAPVLRQACELAAAAMLFVLIAAATHLVTPGRWLPAVAGLLGCAGVLGVVAAGSPTRRWWFWPAVSAVILAGWIEAVAHSVFVLELYSVPVGLLVLAFGVQAARSQRRLSSWLAFGLGLLILTLGSLVLALWQPLSWRAPALGAVALLALLTGSRLRLQAPLVIGAAELALLVVREVSPYALALPRWVVIGTLGVLLLSLGVTWESRLADLRSTRRLLADMQ